jgi:hypothetical protein
VETCRDGSAKRGRRGMDMGTTQTSLLEVPGQRGSEVRFGEFMRKVEQEHNLESIGMAWFRSFGG